MNPQFWWLAPAYAWAWWMQAGTVAYAAMWAAPKAVKP